MSHDEFIEKAKEIVAEYTNAHVDTGHYINIPASHVYVVWSVKALENSKALLGTPYEKGMYYEATLNGAKSEIYFDAYKKQDNKCIKL